MAIAQHIARTTRHKLEIADMPAEAHPVAVTLTPCHAKIKELRLLE